MRGAQNEQYGPSRVKLSWWEVRQCTKAHPAPGPAPQLRGGEPRLSLSESETSLGAKHTRRVIRKDAESFYLRLLVLGRLWGDDGGMYSGLEIYFLPA